MSRHGAVPDRHEPFDELAVGWALHALEPDDEEFFGGHLPGCARCARTVAETTEVMGALAADLPPAAPGKSLPERLRAAVERTDQVPLASAPPGEPLSGPVAVPVPPPRGSAAVGFPGYGTSGWAPDARSPWRRVLPNALAAAAVAAVLALGAWNAVLREARDDAVADAAEQAGIVDSLLEPGTATIAPLTGAGGRIATVVARDTQLQVVAHGLRPNDRESQTYVVWGMADDEVVPLGTFDVVRPRIDLRTVGSTRTGLEDFGAFAISLEPGRQAPSAPTEVVASG